MAPLLGEEAGNAPSTHLKASAIKFRIDLDGQIQDFTTRHGP